jgi:hypothetical protein
MCSGGIRAIGVAAIVGIALVGVTAPAGAAPWGGSQGISNGASAIEQEAVDSYNALEQNYYVPWTSLYRDVSSKACGSYACLWQFSNATAGTVFLYGTSNGSRYQGDIEARQSGLARYADPSEVSPTGIPQPPAYQSGVAPPLGQGGATYYDDNGWVGLNLVHAYVLTSNTSYLTLAQSEFNFAASGWDTSGTGTCPGGVFWEDVAGSQRNVAANGANAELGLELYLRTGNESDLTWATAMYNWVVSCLGTSSGLYNDHVNAGGTTNTTIWSYNQGVMVGAGLLLYQASVKATGTGNSSYLDQAEATAAAAVNYFGTGTTLINQGTAFNAIFFRNLFFLNQVAPDSSYASEASSFASYMWTQRQPETGLFNPQYGVNGTAPMVELYSLLAGSPASP